MINYKLPFDDIEFLLTDVLDLGEILALPGFEDCDRESFFAVTDAIGAFAQSKLLPINKIGDEEGVGLKDGNVVAASGFVDAYRSFCEDGWNALPFESEHGGQQLPFTLHAVLREALAGTNLAFALIHELNFGVYEALVACGSEALKNLYLPRLADGSWAGTMCLTEPHCGTDLGLIKSRAKQNDDGTFALEGAKIFITWGDHDMSDNIVHLVLARIEGAAQGVQGLSLFVAPKFIPDDDGNPGDRNQISITGVEEKMGIHGSPTCSVSFDGAKAWLVGDEGRGLAAMFVMMNAARLSVGLQGLGICETSFQAANEYAHERLQGRAIGGRNNPDAPADPLIVHPDVRRRLAIMKAELDAARALAYWGAAMLDTAHRSPDKKDKALANARISMLTPILKSYISDMGSRFAYEAVQMYGGHGYIKDYGVEQLSRDVRITAIYEGTNAVQAVDLVSRKLTMDEGAAIRSFLADIFGEAEKARQEAPLIEYGDRLAAAAGALERITEQLMNASREGALTSACDYLDMFAITLSAMMSLKSARKAQLSSSLPATRLREERFNSMKCYYRRVLPRAAMLEQVIVDDIGDVIAAPTHVA